MKPRGASVAHSSRQGSARQPGRRSIQQPEVLRPRRRRSARNSRNGPLYPRTTLIPLTWSEAREGGVANLAHKPRAPSRRPLLKRRTSAAEAAILR